ncbi:MAG: hypothetical protein IIW64_02215, partial [Selenomonadaceae bacterium]|nr:hypothetical protein [Selenomonadaceae bacterium]
GVNGPTRNYRQYDTIDALPDKTDRNWKRIYFQPKVEKDKTWNVSKTATLDFVPAWLFFSCIVLVRMLSA